jgi:hypothetical protein
MDAWPKQRLAELRAAAPAKRKKAEPFAVAVLSEAAAAFVTLNCRKATVWLWLMHQARKTGSRTIAVPNGALRKLGVSRMTKHRALKELAAGGFITVEWRPRKTPIVILYQG